MAYSGEPEKLIFKDGECAVYGRNRGKYPLHHFIHNSLALSRDMPPGPLTVSYAGADEWVKGCSRRRLNSNLISLELVEEGVMHYRSARGSYHVGAGQVFIVHFHEDSEMAPETAYLRKHTIILPGQLSAQIAAATGLETADVIDIGDDASIKADFVAVAEILRDQAADFNLQISELTFRLLLKLRKKIQTPDYPPLLSRTVEYIYTHIGKMLTLKELCEFSGATPGTLNNLFKKYFNQSPIDFALRHKIKIAETLLSNQYRYIKEIAAELGYANQFYFAQDFKKRTGMTPSEYRKKSQ